jgi:hypothetical protein
MCFHRVRGLQNHLPAVIGLLLALFVVLYRTFVAAE